MNTVFIQAKKEDIDKIASMLSRNNIGLYFIILPLDTKLLTAKQIEDLLIIAKENNKDV